MVGGRVGFSPGEFLDFLLGWVGIDIADDDRSLADPPDLPAPSEGAPSEPGTPTTAPKNPATGPPAASDAACGHQERTAGLFSRRP